MKNPDSMVKTDKILGVMGLLRRCGKLVYGQDTVTESVKSGHSDFVVLSCDANPKVLSKITQLCDTRGAKYVIFEDISASVLGERLGMRQTQVFAVDTSESLGKRLFELCYGELMPVE